MITIQNESLTVTIDPLGAQLKSIFAYGREYLWQGDPAIWGKRAPILFPVIGRMREGQYQVDGRTYSIPAHGFANVTTFAVTAQTATSVTFSMEHSQETLAVYPFPFRLFISFSLEGSTLHKSHRVENPGDSPLYYQVGGHDGFAVPFHPGEHMDDCHIRIPGVETFSPYEFDEAVTLCTPSRTLPAPGGIFPLKPSTFGLDSVVLDSPPSHRAELLDGAGTVRLAVDFPDMDYITLWTKPMNTNYVCIEPWTSLPDANFVGRKLREKAGIRRLEGGKSEALGYDIVVYEL